LPDGVRRVVGLEDSRRRHARDVMLMTAMLRSRAEVRLIAGRRNGEDDPLVRAIIQFAHALDKQVVAEWVTSAEQLHRLRMLGCDFVQGHLLGEPSAAAAFAERADPR
jgi:EAL domain-containing protein (putative c-di-GMP-specific phosphodiesterase class I)